LNSSYTDKELLQRLAEGDKASFRQLFDAYRLRLFSFVFQLTNSKVDAEEIVQDVFAKLWEIRQTLHTVEHPGKYIYTIARNKTFNHLAKIARDQQLVQQLWVNLSQADHSTEEMLQANESRQLINEAIHQLSQQKQTIFYLSREQGLSHEAIAIQLGLSKSRVKNVMVEVLKHIKDYLLRHTTFLAVLFCMKIF
jgi:RNA polymerase sigma-70 factor (ECF subfamily)